MNDLLRQSNMPVEIVIEQGQKVFAKKNGGPQYNVAELSDGERNAFLLCAEVLTAEPGALIIVDEPERHLHRSIISPLLTLLFRHRDDCAFIVSTHELQLPVDNQDSQTMLVRGCVFQGSNPKSWTADILQSQEEIDISIKKDILGARSKIIFVEGEDDSLDVPLYSLLFPQLSVIPKSSCRDVEYAVRGIRDAAGLHWVNAWGIVDNDQRSQDDINALKENGIFALGYYSVESLYYHPRIVRFVAERQAAILGMSADSLYNSAISQGVEEIARNRDHLVWHAVEKQIRRLIFSCVPSSGVIPS
jgi:predicted ATP-dependent endonuclease of OLD family